MIKYLKNGLLDRAKWDECVAKAYNDLPYAYSWYLDMVSPGWNALVQDDYLSVMPLTQKRKFGISYLCQPYLCQQLGVFSRDDNKKNKIDDFLHAIPEKYRLIEIAINSKNATSISLVNQKVIRRINHELNLKSDYKNLALNYSKSLQRNLKKIKNHKIEIKEGTLSDFYNFKLECIKEKNICPNRRFPKKYYHYLEFFNRRKQLNIKLAKIHDKIIAGGCFITIGKRIFSHTFCTETGRSYGAGFGVIDEYIKIAAGNAQILDFMGSNVPGIASRNLGFGCTQKNYSYISLNRLPKPLQFLKGQNFSD